MSVERDIRKASRFRDAVLTRAEGDRLYGGGGAADWSTLTGKPSTFPPSSHVHPVSEVTGLDEQIRDVVAGFVVAGSNVTVVHNDGADTLTVSASGGGGGSPAMAWVI